MEGEAPIMFLWISVRWDCFVPPGNNKRFKIQPLIDVDMMAIPRVGGAEMLKLQEAIPPVSLIEDSIQGRRAETLVKTA